MTDEFPPRAPVSEPLIADRMNARQVAAFLGVAVATLKRWRSEGRHLGYWRVGRVVWYSRAEVLRFYRTLRHEPAEGAPRC